MEITVTTLHGKIDELLRDRAVQLLERTARLAWRPQSGEIVFDNDRNKQIVELHLHMPGGTAHVPTAEASDFRTAIDRATEKLRNQLDKLSSNPSSRRQPLGEK